VTRDKKEGRLAAALIDTVDLKEFA